MGPYRRLFTAAAVLAAAQVVHATTPAQTGADSFVGLVGGLVLLTASVTAALGAALRSPWAPRLTLVTGATVAVGFLLYHAVPVHSPVTNPYVGEAVGLSAWLSVVASVAAGVWAAVEGWRAERLPSGGAAPYYR